MIAAAAIVTLAARKTGYPPHLPKFLQKLQVAVDRSQTQRRDLLTQVPVDGFHIGMPTAFLQVFKNALSLPGMAKFFLQGNRLLSFR